jgi:hypothetical protein
MSDSRSRLVVALVQARARYVPLLSARAHDDSSSAASALLSDDSEPHVISDSGSASTAFDSFTPPSHSCQPRRWCSSAKSRSSCPRPGPFPRAQARRLWAGWGQRRSSGPAGQYRTSLYLGCHPGHQVPRVLRGRRLSPRLPRRWSPWIVPRGPGAGRRGLCRGATATLLLPPWIVPRGVGRARLGLPRVHRRGRSASRADGPPAAGLPHSAARAGPTGLRPVQVGAGCRAGPGPHRGPSSCGTRTRSDPPGPGTRIRWSACGGYSPGPGPPLPDGPLRTTGRTRIGSRAAGRAGPEAATGTGRRRLGARPGSPADGQSPLVVEGRAASRSESPAAPAHPMQRHSGREGVH